MINRIQPDEEFTRELKCDYKGERYSVRDNGALLRHPREGSRTRPYDNNWTFDKLNIKTGYLEIASVRVHSIVATTFHSVRPSDGHVVDHIDTNKQNNRPENLRWVTRLENVLLNPITARRIALVCGSVEAFLADPSKFRDQFQEPDVSWMCTVSAQEAKLSLDRMLAWAKSDKRPTGGSLGEWIFNREIRIQIPIENTVEEPEILVMSKTINAAQRNWRTPSEFPCCPMIPGSNPLQTYLAELKQGKLFCQNSMYSSHVVKCAISSNEKHLYVMSESLPRESAIKPWALAEVTFENQLFVHTSIRTFFTLEGAEKQFCLIQGLEWTGGDSIDDQC